MEQTTFSESHTEISVDYVAKTLNVSERTVLNYIKTHQISAIKVGKRWFIDSFSFENFQKRNSINTKGGSKNKEAIPATIVSEEKIKQHTTYEHIEKKKEKKNITSLACYRLAVAAFKMPLWQQTEPTKYKKYFDDFQFRILEHLGAGYCTYGNGKRFHYEQVRGLLGAVLSVVYSDDNMSSTYEKDIFFIENEFLFAITSLIRKIEKTQPKFSM